MNKPLRQPDMRLSMCTICPRTGGTCRAGYDMLTRLQAGIAAAGDSIDESFEIFGHVALTSCPEPCKLAYLGTRSGCFLVGDATGDETPDHLRALAQHTSDLTPEPPLIMVLEPATSPVH